MTTEQKQEIILMLKSYREENEISVERACNMVLEAGYSTSPTTAKRIFAKGSENDAGSFRYETLRPYYVVFYGTETPTPKREPGNEEQAQQYYQELEGIKTLLSIKNEQLERMEKENADLRERYTELKQDSQSKIDYLKQRVEDCKFVYHREEDRQEHTIKILRRALVAVSTVLAFTVALVIGILIYDVINRDVGWLREMAAHYSDVAGMIL